MTSGRLVQLLSRCASAWLLWLCLTSLATAHASLTGTEPVDGSVLVAPPKSLGLSFSEPVSPLVLQLVRPDGAVLRLDSFVLRDRTLDIEAPADLGPGTHVLTWRVVSEDGHPVSGSVVFSIGAPSAAPPAAAEIVDPLVRGGLWLAKLALYGGLFIGVGGAFAQAWFLPGRREGSSVIKTSLLIGLLGTAASAGFQGLDALGASLPSLFDPAIWSAALATSFGRTVAAVVPALLLAGLSLHSSAHRSARSLSLAGIAAGAASLALSGHASAAEPQWLTRPSVAIHAAMVAIWIGALVPLAAALRRDAAAATPGLRHFSAWIPFAVLLLVLTGAALAVVQVGSPGALLDTDYGRLLLAKLGLLLLLLGLAVVNRCRLTLPTVAGDANARRHLCRSIAVETMLALVIFGVVAGWRFTPPPRALAVAAAQPASVHIHGTKAIADISVEPGRVGRTTVSALIRSGDFGALAAKEVTFVLSQPSVGIEPIRRKAEPAADGRWLTRDVELPLPGPWTIRVDVLISDFEIARLDGEIEIRP
jgi:copper transport protein